MSKQKYNVVAICLKALEEMEQNVCKKIETDELYLQDHRDELELEQLYEALPIENEHRRLIEDFQACSTTKMTRVVELAYQAGVEAALNAIDE